MIRRSGLAGVLVVCVSVPAWAAEGDPIDVERLAGDASISMPKAHGPEVPLGRVANGRNESPEAVRQLISEIEDQKTVTDILEPKRAAQVDQQLAAAKVRLAIAEARRERDQLRKKGKRVAAAKLDGRINQLKAQLDTMVPPKPERSWWQNMFAREEDEEI